MSWDSRYISFGVLKIEGKIVKVYRDQSSYVNVNVGQPVQNAIWAGGELNITLSDGKVRRYRDQSSYKTV
jgi:hypothetical protein